MTFYSPHPIRQWQLLLMTLLLLMTISVSAQANTAIGTILFVHGTVELIDTKGQTRTASKGGDVFKGDRIISRDASSLQIQMTDKGYFAVRPNSEISLDDYQFNDSAQDKVETSIIRGGLRSITGAIGQKNKKAFIVRTPVATIGIRGTDLTAFFISPEMASPAVGQQGSYLAIESGGGFLQNSAGIQILQPGQAAYTASANIAPASIPQLPGIFLKPTFEELIPGINTSSENQPNPSEEAKEEEPEEQPKEEEEKQEEPQQQEESKEEEAKQEEDEGEDRFSFSAHAYAGFGSADHFLQNYDLADNLAFADHVPMVIAKNSPYESSGELGQFAAGLGAEYQLASFMNIYGKVEFKTSSSNLDSEVSNAETNTDISGGKINLGTKLNFGNTLKAWVDIQHSGYDGDTGNFYDAYDLYQRNEGYSNYYASEHGGLKLAATPGYEGDRFNMGASLDLGPFIGVYGQFISSKNQWDNFYTEHFYDYNNSVYRYDLRHIRSGIYTDIAEGGVRINPILVPIDFYASALIGRFGSEGDEYNQHFDGDLTGVRGRAVFNQDGVVSAYAALTLLELSGSGDTNWYDSGMEQHVHQQFEIDETITNLAAGAEINIAQRFKVQALAQSITTSSKSDGQEKLDTLATELRLRVDL